MNETREDELKPCPLCGMAAVEATYKTLTGADYMVGCNRPCSVTTFGVDRATARRLWNSRPVEDDLRAENERLRRSLNTFLRVTKPISDTVYDDNGDKTVTGAYPYDLTVKVWFAAKAARAALAQEKADG